MLNSAMMSRRTTHSGHSGFTLIEVTVVLCIAGLILGGLWVVSSGLLYTQQLNQLESGIVTTAARIRNFYRDRQIKNDMTNGVSNINNTNLLQMNLVAPELQLSAVTGGLGHTLHPNTNNGIGLITISYDQAQCVPLAANSFAVTLANLTKNACSQLLPRLAGTGGQIQSNGIAALFVNNTNVITTNSFNPTTAETSCADGATVEICFKQF